MNSLTQCQQIWKRSFSSLINCDDEHIKQLSQKSKLVKVAANQRILAPGAYCNDYLLMAEGSLRVQFITETGREVVLYHVNPGDDCILTTSCLFSENTFPAEGITETDVVVIAIPASVFHETLGKSLVFRKFVFSTFSQRLADVISRMEIMCSSSIDCQLARTLVSLGKNDTCIKITHQELASEVGTVREVVSRHLKKFEHSKWVRLGRGRIELIDSEGLQNMFFK